MRQTHEEQKLERGPRQRQEQGRSPYTSLTKSRMPKREAGGKLGRTALGVSDEPRGASVHIQQAKETCGRGVGWWSETELRRISESV